MLDYALLSAISAVVREGSFERAARALNVTPSAVSQRVKQLEERLGAVLIVRGQPCIATETGRLLCSHVEQVGMLEQDLQGALPKLTQANAGNGRVTLRIAVNADSLGTWFIDAMAKFLGAEAVLLDVALDDQEHTVEWLRSGEVLAAVTAHAQPVQGCNSISLGRVNYVAVASPAFMERHFPEGVTAASLGEAPSLTFNRKDRLQSQWVRRVCRREVDIPTHWFPSTQAFIDASVAGIGWGMNPATLVKEHLRTGSLVELVPGRTLSVPLYWQHTRLQVPMLSRLTRAVIAAANQASLQGTRVGH
ncbi:MAG: LysR family transcriptional regulator [Gammaproteobacteria bacterium]|nr:LysR family transcriptional regulator [Gammaproteobacteria bacterium]